jgi:uncharacterized Zn-binding protein involved in type VI secretion
MAQIDYREFNRVFAKYYHPDNLVSRISYRPADTLLGYHLGIVEDNADPDKRGRLKVRFPFWGDKVVSNWIPLLRPYASKEAGAWMLPDIGTQVICCFFNYSPSKPVVIGSVYTPRAKPPLTENPDNNLKVFTTKGGSRIVLSDKDGEEQILIHSKDGKMRMLLDKNKGLSIANEEGDITITCRKLTLAGKDHTTITTKKKLAITCKDDKLTLKARQALALKSGKDVVLKGKKIKLKGNMGVTADGKQVAAKDDQVLGVDLHDIMVPSSSGLVTVPAIPHIYTGKLADKLSTDVTVNDRAAATRDSKSKYNTPGHFPMPPGVKFKKQPSNEGTVSSGTVPSVKINGKEAAVLGSMVKTCNDPQDNETCTVIAIGAAVPLPILVPGMDPEQFKKDGGFIVNTRNPIAPAGKPRPQDVERSLQNPRWSSAKAKAGEEVTLSVDLVNQHANAGVTFTIWEEGAERQTAQPVARLQGQNKGGKAEVRYIFHRPEKDEEIDELKYIFTAQSYRCRDVTADTLTVKRVKPEFSELKWYWADKDGHKNEAEAAELGVHLKISANVNNVEEGELINLKIYKSDYQKEEDFLEQALVELKDNKLEYEWQVDYAGDLNKLQPDEKLAFVFILEKYNVKSEASPALTAIFWVDLDVILDPEHIGENDKFELKSTDGSYKKEKKLADDKIPGDGKITLHFDELKPGLKYTFKYIPAGKAEGLEIFTEIPFSSLI